MTNKNEKQTQEKYYTDYYTASHWCGNGFVLVNNIGEIDPDFYDENAALFAEDEKGNTPEYYQYFITDMTPGDKEYLENTFGLVIGFSPLLDCFVLFVDHYGTSWRYVPCEVKSELWWDSNGKEYAYKD